MRVLGEHALVDPAIGITRRRAGAGDTGLGGWMALGWGLVLVVAYWSQVGGSLEDPLYLLVAAYGTLLSAIGALRAPRPGRRIWWAFAAAQVCFLLGDSLWVFYESVLDVDPFPSVADVAFLGGYPGLALGMLWLVRGRGRGRDRAAFLDSAILTTGISVAGIVFAVGPAATAGGTTVVGQTIAGAYPVGDLLVLALVVRVVTGGIVRNTAVWALFGSVAALLLADFYFVMSVTTGYSYPAWVELGFLVSYLALGFAAVHPSAQQLSEPPPARPDRVTAVRMAWLAAALVIAPLTDQTADMLKLAHSDLAILVGGAIAACFVVIRLWDLVQELQRTTAKLATLARRDGLTGVANRRAWDQELSRSCTRARELYTPLCVGMLDMDNFKLFNDAYGHLAGDMVLKETSAAWSSIVQDSGYLARYGGEEFAVLLPMPIDEAAVFAEHLRRAVNHGQTCSVGLAQWDGVETPPQLLRRADEALYRAKHEGRDRVVVHDGAAPQVVPLASEPDLKSALEPALETAPTTDPVVSSLRAVYQPIVDLTSGRVVGAEALSRFDGGDPREVFDRAARDGTEGPLEARAIRAACEGWSGRGRLAVNASLTALVASEVQAAMPEDLSNIAIEITEADLVGYTPEVTLVLDSLRARGALIVIDDFGTGFSNVQRIAMIRPDVIKLDMALIRGIDSDEMLQAVAASCVHFATSTDSAVVAEGIETEAELAWLTQAGVRFGQGYLLGRPGPMADLAAAQRGSSG